MSSLSKRKIPVRTKIFISVLLFILLSIIVNIIVVRLSINDIYIGLEKKELKKQYKLIERNIDDNNALLSTIYNASDSGIKIKVLDNNLNILYTIFNEHLNDQFTNLDLLLLESLGNKKSTTITLENYNKNGYDLYFIGRVKDGYVILSSSIESLRKDAKTTTIIIIFTSLITLIILLVVANIISKILSNKINEVKSVTNNISNLKFDKKLVLNTNDELSDLFDDINNMSLKLEESIKKLKDELALKEKQESARKKLIANISHEFKTPMTIISGYAQLMLNELEGESKENAGVIISEIDRLNELVMEFLELSRLESEDIKLNKTSVDIKSLIENELKKLSVKINDKNIKVTTQFCEDNMVLADEKQICKVIENILTNAIKFCKHDKLIFIKTYHDEEYFVYDVFNTGDNIKDKDLDNIFNSYYKDKNARNKEGTGLGLTIVNAITKLHNGKCFCINEKDGVRFIVKIKK